MGTTLGNMRYLSPGDAAVLKEAGATWEAGRLTLPMDTTSRRWSTDQEWAMGVQRIWMFELLDGRKVKAVEMNRPQRPGWMVSLA